MSSKLLNYAAASSTNAHSRFVNDTKRRATVVVPGDASSSAPWNYDNLQLADILCPVCQSLVVEPVFLPCQHLFCRNCLLATIETNNLNCPCCRKRFGTWYRNASRCNTLVHERLWQAIQSQFRERLHEEQASCGSSATVGSIHGLTMFHFAANKPAAYRLANPGDIRKEYKEELKRYQEELLSDEKKELIASEQYIINLYKQEGIIDLADSSSHVSVSSTTTPDVQDSAGGRKSITNTSVAGPSSSTGARQLPPSKALTSGQMAADRVSEKVSQPARLNTSKSPSNGSVISISSTSSAASAATATSFVSSSVSERFSLIKSVSQKIGRSAELVKQTANDLHRLTFGKLQQHQKSMGTIDLNKSELCVKPTDLHKAEQRGAVDEEDDTDSLKAEQNHFVPIHTTLPKSSFSLDNVVRVAPIRSPTVSVKYTLTPKKCPYRPLADATTSSPRQSAFSVVNFMLLTPPKKLLGEPSEKSSTSSSSSSSDGSKTAKKTVSSSTARRGRRRRKLKFTPTKARKVTTRSTVVPEGDAEVTTTTASSRSTRRTSDRLPRLLKHAIVSDQQRIEQQIEMERRDFEFAQKLQQKLNRSNGVMQEIHRLYPAARNCSYSLRRKGGNVDAFDRGTTLSDDRSTESTEDTKNLAQKTRKRKATSSSVENDVPTASPPSSTGRAADTVRKRQTRRMIKQEPVEAPPPPVDKQLSVPQRKSTRNKAR
ncbi:E3 ubiquitin-protein ligase rnf168-like [Anopheles bellator]|uniref:E3 ubiquitin-protein ligase rnf168-like n=1 Tax=Anopheles bellator TaxID=139047 RepID=UPI0026471625|nr:E3 ubiquitin-protein ligase rnf168-like [Anopheles bellator]